MKPNRTLILAAAILLIAPLAHESLNRHLWDAKTAPIGSILPIFAVMALGFAAFNFFTGNPNSKQHLVSAVTGAAILFGAQKIIHLIEELSDEELSDEQHESVPAMGI